MGNKDYQRGRKDGKEYTYHPPVKERIFTSYKKDELERLEDYRQGYRHGKQDREKGRK
jgi:hypothetical protein